MQNINIGNTIMNEVMEKNSTFPIWYLAFRPFFAGGVLFSIIAIVLWWASLQGYLSINVYGNWLWWHSHEMIYGFSCAIVVGFLLTAVQHWTGIPAITGSALAGLFTLWLLARVVMFLPVPTVVVMIPDVLFLLLAAITLARPLVATRMYRNIVFVVILLLLMVLNVGSHLALLNGSNPMPYFHGAIMIIVLVITVMGGRVIPLFTANALKIKSKKVPKIIDLGAIGSMLILCIFALLNFLSLPALLVIPVTVVGLITHSYRLYCWFDKGILNKSILWSLHLAYAFIPLGILLLLLQAYGSGIATSLPMHGFTVGGIGGVILAMISRVALGHTGRPLILPKLMPVSLSLMFLGGLVRVLLPWIDMSFYRLAIECAALCWGLAFTLFLICYLPFLFTVRADGKPG